MDVPDVEAKFFKDLQVKILREKPKKKPATECYATAIFCLP